MSKPTMVPRSHSSAVYTSGHRPRQASCKPTDDRHAACSVEPEGEPRWQPEPYGWFGDPSRDRGTAVPDAHAQGALNGTGEAPDGEASADVGEPVLSRRAYVTKSLSVIRLGRPFRIRQPASRRCWP